MRSTPQTWSLSHVGAYRGWPSSQLFAGACNVAVSQQTDRRQESLTEGDCQCLCVLHVAVSVRCVGSGGLKKKSPALSVVHQYTSTGQSAHTPTDTPVSTSTTINHVQAAQAAVRK